MQYIVFKGKQDLEKNLEFKLRHWLHPDTMFVVLRDQDNEDCKEVKAGLNAMVRNSRRERVLVRIACRELESFYLGDLLAVEKGLACKNLGKHQDKKTFRGPDLHVLHPAEELRTLTRDGYYKVSGSRAIAPYLCLEDNRSKSFNMLISGIKDLLAS